MRRIHARRLVMAAIFTAALISGCASTPDQYGPALKAGAPGYSETAIENNRYRVTYHVRSGGAARASDLALLRAAELTLQHGYDWFTVDTRGTESQGGGEGPRVSIGTGYGSFGGHTGVSIGTGVGFNLGGGKDGAATTLLEFRMGKGAKPQDVAVYDARDVQASIRARM